MMDLYAEMTKRIIENQEKIIGPVALEQARAVEGLILDWANKAVSFTGDPRTVVSNLVNQYKYLFGQISVEVCKEAVAGVSIQIPHDQLPELLQ